MSIQEMKSRIHQLVDEVKDEAILEEVNRILSGEPDTLDDLTDEQLARLETARQEVREGRFSTLAAHKQKLDQWLSDRK